MNIKMNIKSLINQFNKKNINIKYSNYRIICRNFCTCVSKIS